MTIFFLLNFFSDYTRAPVSTDSVSAVYRGPGKKKLKIKEINGS
jgi:hypothetical protein